MGLREENKIQTRQAICKNAVRLFKKNGFGAVGVRDIAKESGISIGTLYNYFSTKEEIIFALVDALTKELFSEWAQMGQKKSAQFSKAEDFFVAVFNLHLTHFKSDRLIVSEFLNILTNPDFVREQFKDRILNYKNVFWEFIKESYRANGFKLRDTPFVRDFFWSVYVGSMIHWVSEDKPSGRLDEYFKTVALCLAHGIGQ